MNKKVSVIIPIYNEEKYIANCLESFLHQNFPLVYMECICVDGNSTDRTIEIVKDYIELYPDAIKLLINENRTQSYAMNMGIEIANGDYIIRFDAHTEYPNDYIQKCVECLETIDADNVGGIIDTIGKTKKGKTIAKMLSSRFGVGNSQFRTGNESAYVDTVPFGAFKKETLQKIKGFDTRLDRNEDNEINYRIRKNGGKVYLSKDITASYYCRDTIKGLLSMGFSNGKWNVITMKVCPGSMRTRHFIPMLFVISIISLALLGLVYKFFWYALFAEIGLYFLLDIIFSSKIASNYSEFLKLLFLFPAFHITYGSGSMAGVFQLLTRKY